MTYNSFIEKQNTIYSKLEDFTNVSLTGISPANLENSGYLISLRHKKEISSSAELCSLKIDSIVSSITYNENNLHTTLASTSFNDDDFSLDWLDLLSDTVQKHISLAKNISIFYSGWLLGSDSFLAKGISNKSFYDLVMNIYESSLEKKCKIDPAWGSHITLNRFNETVSPEDMNDLLQSIESLPVLGESKPNSLDVGYFVLTEHSFDYEVYQSFKF